MDNLNESPALRGKLGNLKQSKQRYDNSLATQRARILKHFAENPRLSTIQAREEMGILHPCGRVMELRKRGYRIETHWIKEPDLNGVLHRIGLYVFQGMKKEVNHERQ
jgi:hypothetical protein